MGRKKDSLSSNEISDQSEPKNDQEITFNLKPRSKVNITLTLQPDSEVEVTIQTNSIDGKIIDVEKTVYSNPVKKTETSSSQKSFHFPTKLPRFQFQPTWQSWLIAAALIVYLVVRFIGLDSYPIYFFTDEAVQTVLASDLVRDNFESYTHEVLPTYFVNGGQYNLGTSVYLQVLPTIMFGKSIWVTRGTSVLVTLFAALALALLFKNILKSRYPFAVILLLSLTPAWFLHSRTAFETVLAVSFFAMFLYTYMMYRNRSPKYLFPAVIFGALCFYSYSPAQLVMAVTLLGLFISDFRTHLKNWKTVLIGLGIAALLAIPYIRFLILHPDENIRHLQILNSYWVQAIPFIQKLGIYFKEYLKLLNPLYWFLPNQIDLERHVMKGYGHLLRWTIPFFLFGLGIAVRKIKDPNYRVFLIALLAAPTGAALAGAGITRALFMVIPAVILTMIGLEQVLVWLERWKAPRTLLIAILFAGLTLLNGLMLRDALVNGSTWYSNYGLGGQQYGAKQVFGEIKTMLKEDPSIKFYMSPSWTNGTDTLARFFFEDPLPFQMGSLDGILYQKSVIVPNEIFILSPEEMQQAKDSGKFTDIQVVKIIPYPNNQPGFYFVKMRYVDNIDQILAVEHLARQILKDQKLVTYNGIHLDVRYPDLDMGEIQNIFDGVDDSLVRTSEANPMVLDVTFLQPTLLSELTIRIGGTPTTMDLTIQPSDGSSAINLHQVVTESNDFRNIVFTLEKPVTASSIKISILNTYDPEPSHVHVWEVRFK